MHTTTPQETITLFQYLKDVVRSFQVKADACPTEVAPHVGKQKDWSKMDVAGCKSDFGASMRLLYCVAVPRIRPLPNETGGCSLCMEAVVQRGDGPLVRPWGSPATRTVQRKALQQTRTRGAATALSQLAAIGLIRSRDRLSNPLTPDSSSCSLVGIERNRIK